MPKLRHFGAQSYPTTTSFRDKERKVFASAAKFAKPSTVSLEKTSSAFLQLQNLLCSAKYCTENKLDNF